jgi:hypothetical protein
MPSGILAIDLCEFKAALDTEPRIMSHDYVNYLPYQEEATEWYPKGDLAECLARYEKIYRDAFLYFEDFHKENAWRPSFPAVSAISVWEQIGRENAAVRAIRWTDDDSFSFLCGKEGTVRFDVTLKDGKPTLSAPVTVAPYAAPTCEIASRLPAVPGRRYLAKATAAVLLPSGAMLVGTADSMLALVKDGKVFSLGAVTACGGIHAMDITPNGTVYGVAGHPLGVGQMFRYTEDEGLELLGLVPECFAEGGRNVALFRPTTLKISPSGRYMAIGGEDELGGVTLITL